MNKIILLLGSYGSLFLVIFILSLLYKKTRKTLIESQIALSGATEKIEHDKEKIEYLKKKLKDSATSSTDSRLDFMRN